MNKKSMELSLNTVVVAIILLIVLIVLIFLFVTRSNIFGKSLEGQACNERGGSPISSGPCPDGYYMIYAKSTPDAKTATPCCVKIELPQASTQPSK